MTALLVTYAGVTLALAALLSWWSGGRPDGWTLALLPLWPLAVPVVIVLGVINQLGEE